MRRADNAAESPSARWAVSRCKMNRARLEPRIEPARAGNKPGRRGTYDYRADHRPCRGAGDHRVSADFLLGPSDSGAPDHALAGPGPGGRRHDPPRHPARHSHLFLARRGTAHQGRTRAAQGEGHPRRAARHLHCAGYHPGRRLRHLPQGIRLHRSRTQRRGGGVEHHPIRHIDADRRHGRARRTGPSPT